MHALSRNYISAVLLFGICCAGGCTQLDLATDWDWYGNDKVKVPNNIVCFWKDTVRVKTGEPSTRGFGGRVYFYEPANPKPIKVDGQLIVYAFEDEGFDPKYSKPARHFIFTEETFSKHHIESDLGHCYDFFLPWDAVGGRTRESRPHRPVRTKGRTIGDVRRFAHDVAGKASRESAGGARQSSITTPTGGSPGVV